jgi:hypothetical protein
MNKGAKILILVAIAVCAVAMFLGIKGQDKKETTAEVKQEQPQTKQEAYEYEKTASTETASQPKDFSSAEITRSKNIVNEFIKVYHTYDAHKPLQNIEYSKVFMSEDLYNTFIENPPRGTLDAVKKKVQKMNIESEPEVKKGEIVWTVIVNSEDTDNDGKKHTTEYLYYVQLQKQGELFKVTGVVDNASS